MRVGHVDFKFYVAQEGGYPEGQGCSNLILQRDECVRAAI